MRYSPQQVNDMTLWQFGACADGYRKVNGPANKADTPPSDEEYLAWAETVRGNA